MKKLINVFFLLLSIFCFSQNDIVNIKGVQTITGLKKFTVSPTAPTLAPGTNTTQLATTAFVTAATAGGIPTLQQVSEVGSVAVLHQGAVTPITVGFSVISDVDNKVSAMSASLSSVSLTTGTTDLGANGFGATQSLVAVQFQGLSRLNFDATTSVVRGFPLKYYNEAAEIRPLLIGNDMIPSVGKVQDMIDDYRSIVDDLLTVTQTAATLNAKYPSVPIPYIVFAPNVGSSMTYVKISSTKWMAYTGVILM